MREQHYESAVPSGAVEIGVANSEQYETLAARLHGYGGERHECRGVLRPGSESLCGRCGKSTTGSPIVGRAGEVYSDEGHRLPPREERFTTPDGVEHVTFRDDVCDYNDALVAAGNLSEIQDGVDGECGDPNRVDDRMLQPDYEIKTTGGTKSRTRTPGNSPDPARVLPPIGWRDDYAA